MSKNKQSFSTFQFQNPRISTFIAVISRKEIPKNLHESRNFIQTRSGTPRPFHNRWNLNHPLRYKKDLIPNKNLVLTEFSERKRWNEIGNNFRAVFGGPGFINGLALHIWRRHLFELHMHIPEIHSGQSNWRSNCWKSSTICQRRWRQIDHHHKYPNQGHPTGTLQEIFQRLEDHHDKY